MRQSTIFTIAGVTLISGLVAYAIYFDYKRRNDGEFRRKLRKDKKRVDRTVAQIKETQTDQGPVSSQELRAALEQVKNEEIPKNPEEKEHYFMSQVSIGESLCTQGPSFHLPAALCFYRALRVYPSPVELIVIYQKTVPEPVFKIVMEMTNLDVSSSSSSPSILDVDDETSSTKGGPPSETSSQEWDKIADSGPQTPAR